MSLRNLSQEARFTIIIIAVFLAIPLVFYLIDLFVGSSTPPPSSQQKEKTVIVSEAEKKAVLSKIPPKAVLDNLRDAIKQGNNSTARIQLNKLPQDSKEYEELSKLLAEVNHQKNRQGVRKEGSKPDMPVKYFDESTPRDRSTDALYLYITDFAGGTWLRFCIQSVGKSRLDLNEFRIKADGKTFTIRPGTVKKENADGKVSEYFDAPFDQNGYAAVEALKTARKASLVAVGTKGERERVITEDEKKGLRRIMETYVSLGGNTRLYQSAGKEIGHSAPSRSGSGTHTRKTNGSTPHQ